MKFRSILLATMSIFVFTGIRAQEKGNDNVVTQDRPVAGFTGIIAGGTAKIELQQGEPYSVKVKTDENLQDNVITEIIDENLIVKSTKLRNPTELIVYVTTPKLKYLEAGGATDIEGKSVFESDELEIRLSGAASADLSIEVSYLETSVSGAADLKLSGKADTHNLQVSGAGSLSAKNLESRKAMYSVSGAGDAKLNVTEEISGTKKGSADISYTGNPVSKNIKGDDYTVRSDNYYDSVKVKVGGINVEVYDRDDSVRVVIGDRELKVDEDGNIRYRRSKKPKFNGHWAGFEMGLNGYVTPDGNQSFPKEYEFLDLRMTKSVAVHLNFFEQNVAFSRNQKWGMVTGLGINWNNYRFDHPTRLDPDSSTVVGYLDKGISIRKSKLTAFYLNVPLLFEFQTNSRHKKNSFHIAVGMIGSARLSSHTKKYYDERNKEFTVTQYDAESDSYVDVFTAISPDRSKTKEFDDFHLQPFKFDATARIGWGFINLFATYSVNEMFKKDKGPELYPWTIGITFVNF
ncbi:MAG: DUF2807 domain-containing protein [Bacteroidales bacterium]|nr:DUF2807 domain-containing protein [Bacteroidales bacterium]